MSGTLGLNLSYCRLFAYYFDSVGWLVKALYLDVILLFTLSESIGNILFMQDGFFEKMHFCLSFKKPEIPIFYVTSQ